MLDDQRGVLRVETVEDLKRLKAQMGKKYIKIEVSGTMLIFFQKTESFDDLAH